MKLKIEIDLDGDAFSNGAQDARIELRNVLSDMLDGWFITTLTTPGVREPSKLRDENGNTCGHWSVTK